LSNNEARHERLFRIALVVQRSRY